MAISDNPNSSRGFFGGLFGPSKAEIWRQLADAVNGKFIDGGFLGFDRVEVVVEPWIVTLDTFRVQHGKTSTLYTRMRSPFVSRKGFTFNIYNESIFSPIGKALGGQDVVIGDAEFDRTFIVKTDDEFKVRALLADPALRQLLLAQPRVNYRVKDDEGWFATRFPAGVDELYFTVTGVLKDLGQLESLFNLFATTLHRLCEIEEADQSNPQIKL